MLRLVGREDLATQSWFETGAGRAAHVDEIDDAVASWIGARTRRDVVDAFERADAAVAPVYDAFDVIADPQLQAIGAIASIADDRLGHVLMSNVIARLSETPGEIRWTGRDHGADTEQVLAEIGIGADELAALRAEGAA